MNNENTKFLTFFPNHVYRYIDQTGAGRPPVSSLTKRDEYNLAGFEAYFTVNGFENAPDAKKESCTNINAFFVDIDGRKDAAELEQIKKKLDPTFILETKNGYHIYWLLDEPIFKAEVDNWDELVARWERIEQSIVTTLKSDPVVKDITRILRIPNSYYWKKTGDSYKNGIKDALKIKGIYKNVANTYSMDTVEEAFPVVEVQQAKMPFTLSTKQNAQAQQTKKFADAEKVDFFNRVNEEYPIDERDSFKALISGEPGTLPPNVASRNQALLVTASLMRQAEWPESDAVAHIMKVGWHGIESEPGGMREITTTINSAYRSGYTFSYKNEIIAHNMSHTEQMKIQAAYTNVAKAKRETDKIRFANYEREILVKHPYLRKNEIGIIFNYVDGVYKMMSDQELEGIILNGLYEDMLWGFRNNKSVSDKISCLISVIPDLELTDDKGYIANVKNGLLNLVTRELMPHTPDFVSLVQYQVVYDPTATCPNWTACIEAWVSGPESDKKALLLQQFSGYCLSSSMTYDKALFIVGDGGNGKSTFVDTITMVLGADTVSHIDLESLYGQYGMKGLIGKRLNVIEEVAGNYYQSNKLKKLISGEKVTIDMKYKDQFTFRPQAKFIFAVNMMPRVDDTSTATERRTLAMQFKNNFRRNPNTQLRTASGLLASELPGIFNWMIEGATKLKDMGKFIETEEQNQMLSEYRQENSSVEGFISECIEISEGKITSSLVAYDEYKKYCAADGRKFKSKIAFIKEMVSYGKRYGTFEHKERESGKDVSRFIGFEISNTWKDENDSFRDYRGHIVN